MALQGPEPHPLPVHSPLPRQASSHRVRRNGLEALLAREETATRRHVAARRHAARAASAIHTRRSVSSFFRRLAAFAVEAFLVPSALGRSIVSLAPLIAALATMVQAAAEGTAEIQPACVAGIRKEANPAVATGHRAAFANQDDRARRHRASVDTDEQADGRGRPGANPRETKRIPRWLQQKRQVLGYNADRYWHILVLLTRRQSIEGKGEDFLCLSTKKSAVNSRDRSTRYQLANLISLAQLIQLRRGLLKTLLGKKNQPPDS